MFARWRNLKRHQCLLFKFDGVETLRVEVFSAWGDRIDCCVKDTSNNNDYNSCDEGAAKSSFDAVEDGGYNGDGGDGYNGDGGDGGDTDSGGSWVP